MDNVFTVLPMNQILSLAAGETYEGELTIVNPIDATSNFEYKIEVSPYGVSGDDYAADLMTETTRTQIVDWIKVSEPTGSLRPNESRVVKYTIQVPEGAPAGGQYAAIAVSSNPNDEVGDKVAVKNVFEMASLIYAQIQGETTHDGQIEENDVPGFVMGAPINVTTRFSNNGNIHEVAVTRLEVTDAITGRQILPIGEDDGTYSELIMPETERLMIRDINDLPLVGIVHVKQTAYYNGETSVAEQNVIICPIWFIVAVVVVLGAVIGLIVRMIMKKHKRGVD